MVVTTIRSWFSALIVWKLVDGVLYVLLQDALPHFGQQRKQTKFPGGGSEDHPEDRNFFATGKREFQEETHLRFKEGEPDLPAVYSQIKGDCHQQLFYLVPLDSLEGELRTEVIFDNNSTLFPPYWVRVDEMGSVCLHENHEPAWQEAKKKLQPQPSLVR